MDDADLDPENLEFKRMFTGMHCSQPEAARQLGITSGAVSRYLAGKIRPRRSVLRLMADITGERLNLPGEESARNERAEGFRWIAEWEAEILRVLRSVDTDQRARAVAAIRDLVQALSARNRRRAQPPDRLPSSEQLVKALAGDIISKGAARPASGAGAKSAGGPAQSAASISTPPRPSRRPARSQRDSESSTRDVPD